MKRPSYLEKLEQDLLQKSVRAYGRRRGDWRLYTLAKQRLSGWRLAQDAWGNTWLCDLDSYIDLHVFLYGAYERAQVSLLREQVTQRQATYFLDIGANIGGFTLPVSQLPGVQTIAFEPDPDNRQQLLTNLMLNRRLQTVQVLPFGLSDHAGSASLFQPEGLDGTRRNAGLKSLERTDAPHAVTVELRRLDDLLALRGESLVVKIDVEGHEAAVLQGALRTLRENRVSLLIESFEDKVAQTKQILRDAGLRELTDPRLEAHNYLFVNDSPAA